MKKNALIASLFILGAISFSQEIYSKKYDAVIASGNHSMLTEEAVGSEISVTGLLTVKKDSFSLRENPDSRSAVTFVLEVKGWCLKRKLKKLNGKIITVTGTVTKADSVWTKGMKVQEIKAE